ncbi:MAG: 4-coumarate--CoA ligase family protein [Nitrospinota bacterium]|nr:MAG: 4-coumarate--CoA ligase family protein [Nitrospinota bacterium]
MLIYGPWFSFEPYPVVPLPDFIGRMVERTPDRPAFISIDGQEHSFAAVWKAARGLTRVLQDDGLGKGERVAIFSPNAPEYFVAFQAILSAGGTVTTMNPLYKEREVLHQLEDCQATAIFVARPLEPLIQSVREQLPHLRQVYHLEAVWEMAAQAPGEPYPVSIDPQKDVAVLPYSSGTTGLPKGVMLTHYNLTSNIRQLLANGLINRYSVLLDFLPFYHIYGMTVLMSAGFAVGTTQVVMPRFDPETCLELIQRYRITNLFVVPPALLALINVPNPTRFDTSSLEFILSGAAPLPPEVAKQAQSLYGCTVLQGYGLTETSPVTNTNPVHRIKLTSVGPPIADTLEKIVDLDDGHELGPHEIGELLVKGPQVMQGYWQRPEESAESFTSDGWLRTGDIAQADEEGYVYIVDRKKEMIKYKGYQVAPAELEALLMEHPAVFDAAVVPKPDPAAGEVPKAFVLLRSEARASAEEILRFVEERVAPYKKIRDIEFVDAIPKTLSGKILRRDLIAQERAKARQAEKKG